jgi:hypothetical protein
MVFSSRESAKFAFNECAMGHIATTFSSFWSSFTNSKRIIFDM